MPKRTDIYKILIIGSGPIIIGQACEFDYSGVQACKVLKKEGFEIVLINSNPATIMTDPEMADRTYVEPITPETVAKIIELERPDSLLPTLGGQTGLNTALKLAENGVLDKFGVRLLAAQKETIQKAEDRDLFKQTMTAIGLAVPRSDFARSEEQADEIIQELGFPVIIRPSFTLGGTGGSVAYNVDKFKDYVSRGLNLSPINQVLIEESVLGWKEYELEVMRDAKDNVVIVCPVENFHPMGIHTGDSITVAPAQTLTDREYQLMRDAAIKIIRAIGVETGGCNIQFAVNPKDGKLYVIEMNPRVSRSSALASKATGFPIAKIAALLAVGYTLDEIQNDITKKTPACFEPTIDYCVVKIPRFTFEKFPQMKARLTVQMKSVGEVMAIGRTFKESLQKAVRSLDIGRYSLNEEFTNGSSDPEQLKRKLQKTSWDSLWFVAESLRQRISIDEIHQLTGIDPWFLGEILEIIDLEQELKSAGALDAVSEGLLRQAKEFGFSDRYLAKIFSVTELNFRRHRQDANINAVYKMVDTCGAEFEASTPYLYSTYEFECEANPDQQKKVIILGGGPNRIGQGIEFDYCCVHAAFALRDEGFESIMVNCNPETVSTDYDTSDKLYFEPLTLEDVLNIYEKEKPLGIIAQFGGQTPLNLVHELEAAGVQILGTSPETIDLAEDRDRFRGVMEKLGIAQPPSGMAVSLDESLVIAKDIGYPLMVRPSYVLGGRGMVIVHDEVMLKEYMAAAVEVTPERPILIDKFLEQAIEVEADAIADGTDAFVPAIMEHIELAGVHSGDSACVIPPISIPDKYLQTIREYTKKIAIEFKVIGLMNIQYAISDGKVYILEANPRASRTVPFVSKVCNIAMAKIATQIIMGKKLSEMNLEDRAITHFGVKEAVFPFNMFPEVDPLLGPEMRSTGEVLGMADSFGLAFYKSQQAIGQPLPKSGTVLITVTDEDKSTAGTLAHELEKMGFTIRATQGTHEYFQERGLHSESVLKMFEG
ncbi:MAG: carbamoyl-phosphate synthase large subunit, partial [Planctomycetes bacterium]|nr:carbamoyl-phosphate synthase large subunit [Planctomycetota bacterium]